MYDHHRLFLSLLIRATVGYSESIESTVSSFDRVSIEFLQAKSSFTSSKVLLSSIPLPKDEEEKEEKGVVKRRV